MKDDSVPSREDNVNIHAKCPFFVSYTQLGIESGNIVSDLCRSNGIAMVVI